jgi:endonuclease YncB( thermonuclease family)
MKLLNRCVLIMLLGMVACKAHNSSPIPRFFSAKVIAIKDGDTIEVLYLGKLQKIRLAHIDCPEIGKQQPFGRAAKQFTADLCFGQIVNVVNENKFDRYKRLIAVVENQNGNNVNKALVAAGLAWHYTAYSTDQAYTRLQAAAKAERLGLWAEESPTPPWQWRKQ